MSQLSPEELIKALAKEVGRLQKLCKANGIDPKPPNKGPGASISVEAKVTVFKTKEEAEEYQKTLNKS